MYARNAPENMLRSSARLNALMPVNALMVNKLRASDQPVGMVMVTDGQYATWATPAAAGLATSEGFASLSDVYLAMDLAQDARKEATRLDDLTNRKIDFELDEKADRLGLSAETADRKIGDVSVTAAAAAALASHEADTTNIHGIADTSAIVFDGDTAGGVLSGTYPSPGFAVDMATQAELDAHTSDTTDAHAGSAITNTPAGNISSTTVQLAINELDSEKASASGVLSSISPLAQLSDVYLAMDMANDAQREATRLDGLMDRKVEFELSQKADMLDVSQLKASTVMDGDTAGGVLSGTYPSPGFAVDMATQAELDAEASTRSAADALLLSTATAATTYLKLDGSNGPITGDLTIGDDASNQATIGSDTSRALFAHEGKFDTTNAAVQQDSTGNTFLSASSAATMQIRSGTNAIASVTSLGLLIGTTTWRNFTAKGGLLAGTAANNFAELGVGSDNQVLTANSGTATGMGWATTAPDLLKGIQSDVYLAMDLAQDALREATNLDAATNRRLDYELDQKADYLDVAALWANKIGGIKMGTYTTITTTGNASITGIGFRPRALLIFGTILGDQTTNTQLTVGGTDGTTQVSVAIAGANSGPTLHKNIETDAFFLSIKTDGVIAKEFAFTSFDADGFTFNRVTNDGNAYTMAYIAIG